MAQMFARLLLVCMHHRWITVGVTVAAFFVALFGMKFVQQQFFPSSDRSELVIDWNLPQNASIADTNAQMARFEREQLQGNGSVRIGRLMSASARRGSCCHSTCRRPIRGLASRWS